jgi:WbqC-like protein family
MTAIAIMQPTYLPWIGYFGLMDRVETFVYLDSVQFARRSWQQRNRVKCERGEVMLTIPVAKKGMRDQKIAQVEILYGPDFPRRHLDILTDCYRRAPYFEAYAPVLSGILHAGNRKLADLTIAICEWLAQTFGIAARRVRAVSLDSAGTKADLLVHLCQQLGATRYISPVGSLDYLAQSDAFARAGIELCYHVYEHPEYPQLHGSFQPFMAAVDLLFNVGPNSLAVIRSGQRAMLGPHQV